MNHFSVTEVELLDLAIHLPRLPTDQLLPHALMEKGAKFKRNLSGTRMDELVPPYKVWKDPMTREVHVLQGGTT